MKSFISRAFILLSFVFLMATAAIAQPPPPSQHGQEGNQEAPIGSGLVILAALGAAYGARKVYVARKKLQE